MPLIDVPRTLRISCDYKGALPLQEHVRDVIALIKRNASDESLAQDCTSWI